MGLAEEASELRAAEDARRLALELHKSEQEKAVKEWIAEFIAFMRDAEVEAVLLPEVGFRKRAPFSNRTRRILNWTNVKGWIVTFSPLLAVSEQGRVYFLGVPKMTLIDPPPVSINVTGELSHSLKQVLLDRMIDQDHQNYRP